MIDCCSRNQPVRFHTRAVKQLRASLKKKDPDCRVIEVEIVGDTDLILNRWANAWMTGGCIHLDPRTGEIIIAPSASMKRRATK